MSERTGSLERGINQYVSMSRQRVSGLLAAAMRSRATRKRGGRKLLWAMGLMVAYFCIVMPAMVYLGGGRSDEIDTGAAQARRLAGNTECTGDEGGAGHAVAFFLIILFCFLGLAVVCDDFFVPSLEELSEVCSVPARRCPLYGRHHPHLLLC